MQAPITTQPTSRIKYKRFANATSSLLWLRAALGKGFIFLLYNRSRRAYQKSGMKELEFTYLRSKSSCDIVSIMTP